MPPIEQPNNSEMDLMLQQNEAHHKELMQSLDNLMMQNEANKAEPLLEKQIIGLGYSADDYKDAIKGLYNQTNHTNQRTHLQDIHKLISQWWENLSKRLGKNYQVHLLLDRLVIDQLVHYFV